MRTTLTLSDATLERARRVAKDRGLGLSKLIDEAATIGLTQMSGPVAIVPDSSTGFPTFSAGVRTTRADVEWAKDAE
ncbi:MAG: hypothetical protein LBG11_10995 [Bifidobacteriaceae bacterium]|jgi:hypothetical protein|nr:hypothetical protein [Bifidobacteriaceae bacterium]